MGIELLCGYEPLISSENSEACLGLNYIATIDSNHDIPIDYLRKAAVKWYIVPRDKVDEYSKRFNAYGIVEKYDDENRIVFYDNKAYPMVFYSNGEKIENQDYQVTANTIELNVDNQQSKDIIFNNIYNPFFKGFVDGEKTELTPVDNIYFSISVPKGNHHISIRYRDPYLILGTYITGIFFNYFDNKVCFE